MKSARMLCIHIRLFFFEGLKIIMGQENKESRLHQIRYLVLLQKEVYCTLCLVVSESHCYLLYVFAICYVLIYSFVF
jgi:hypothetical protein